ncbi:MAG: hypothetical protein H6709_09000 [Kofleriaceae bacterium]|nr:hypothetical protein [Myxococcales bacterium]MCB9565143.1 hypothetical protein [Kofleriaceae bacterium]MCB9572208.1 hypothetical protein [Kofleriaceae bacterium]
MRRTLIAVVVLIAAVAAVGCSRAGEESEAKRAPKTPPPPAVEVPDDLQIAVTIDGRDAPPLTAARLRAVEPDFHDAERRAWRIVHLVPEADRAGAIIEARGPSGVSIKVPRPDDAQQPQPVLFLTRRGDVVVAVMDPANPFPAFHGQGGQLRRPGDATPRLSPVVALAIDHPVAP